MPAIIHPVSPITSSGQSASAAPELVLTPGAVVDARVLAVREGLVRIAIAGMALDVLSEVALQPGTNLKLAVSQTGDGIRLAIVPSDTAKPNAPALPMTSASSAGAADVATSASLQKAASPPIANAGTAPALSAEAMAVARAVQAAAPRQASLTPLFANLPVIVASPAVPQNVQQAASQLLAARTPLDEGLNAADLRQAFQKSGLFLEASLARGAMPSGAPDLKAALVVFRQMVSNWLGQAATAQTPTATPAGAAGPSQLPEAGLANSLIPPGVRPSGESMADPAALLRNAATQTGDAILKGDVARQQPNALAASPARTGAEPPPPFRGALPSPQPIASPSLVPDLAVANAGRQLLDQTDAALSRQTLLQVASLPDRPDQAGNTQNQQPRWSFEIPFATPQGTAVAQFEISRDGGKEQSAEGSSRVWRARFTLDVEPAGPVHALVSLVGDKTSVKIWAERPDTAERLRAGTEMLGHALRQADLVPGDILVGEGRPVQAAKALTGHFLDRAT
jgi:hypothetical protein